MASVCPLPTDKGKNVAPLTWLYLEAVTIYLIGPGLFDLIYTMACHVPMTTGMHAARLGIADTRALGTQPTRLQLLVRWLVKWAGLLALPPVSWGLVFALPTRRPLHEMASRTITYRRPI